MCFQSNVVVKTEAEYKNQNHTIIYSIHRAHHNYKSIDPTHFFNFKQHIQGSHDYFNNLYIHCLLFNERIIKTMKYLTHAMRKKPLFEFTCMNYAKFAEKLRYSY